MGHNITALDNILRTLPEDQILPVIEVADTARMAKAWMDDQGLDYTATDVLTMTRLIMTRETFQGGFVD
jgi:hypothetical protein